MASVLLPAQCSRRSSLIQAGQRRRATSLRTRLFTSAKKHPSPRLRVAALRGTNMSGIKKSFLKNTVGMIAVQEYTTIRPSDLLLFILFHFRMLEF